MGEKHTTTQNYGEKHTYLQSTCMDRQQVLRTIDSSAHTNYKTHILYSLPSHDTRLSLRNAIQHTSHRIQHILYLQEQETRTRNKNKKQAQETIRNRKALCQFHSSKRIWKVNIIHLNYYHKN